jgi:hypothetical protein
LIDLDEDPIVSMYMHKPNLVLVYERRKFGCRADLVEHCYAQRPDPSLFSLHRWGLDSGDLVFQSDFESGNLSHAFRH